MRRLWIACVLLLFSERASGQQLDSVPKWTAGSTWHWGAHAVGLVTRVMPAPGESSRTEAYVTQPELMGGFGTRNGMFSMLTTISLEGLTLANGELGPGTFGEGYVDRRHPHTYLHELLAVASVDLPAGVTGSVTAGRGFAPFGTDDPMIRPFVKFPVNHHLSQVLERLLLIGGLRAGFITVEVGAFSGNEPLNVRDVGNPSRFADSWSARVTLRPQPEWELQASRAYVNSPEEPTGHDNDRRKFSASLRYQGRLKVAEVYGLAEWARSTIVSARGDYGPTSSLLMEASAKLRPSSIGVRLERTERHEGMREGTYRAPWPPTDHFIIGTTVWSVASVRAQHDTRWRSFALAPFVETSLSNVRSMDGFFDARQFYGSNNIWTLSGGVRMDLGPTHDRMGRYGVALPPAPSHGNHH